MVKKLIFTVVLLLGLYLASVTAFAENTGAVAPENVFAPSVKTDSNAGASTEQASNKDTLATTDKGLNPFINPETSVPAEEAVKGESAAKADAAKLEMNDYIEKYSELFFTSKQSPEDFIVSIKSSNHNDLSLNPLSYVLSGSVKPTEEDVAGNPVVILFYIKENGKYIPLYLTDSKDKKTNYMEKEAGLIFSYVDFLNLGYDKPNDIRIAAFRKNDIDKLELNKNLQIKDLQITVSKNDKIVKPFDLQSIIKALELK